MTEKDRKRQRSEEKKALVKRRKKHGKRERMKRIKKPTKNRMTNYAGVNRIKEKHGIANHEETSQTQKNQGKSRRVD